LWQETAFVIDMKSAGKSHKPPRDARSFALLLIDRFGERAVSFATYQSLKAISSGDTQNASRWRWMAEVTREVLRTDVNEQPGA
jgi:hypothetical protein